MYDWFDGFNARFFYATLALVVEVLGNELQEVGAVLLDTARSKVGYPLELVGVSRGEVGERHHGLGVEHGVGR